MTTTIKHPTCTSEGTRNQQVANDEEETKILHGGDASKLSGPSKERPAEYAIIDNQFILMGTY